MVTMEQNFMNRKQSLEEEIKLVEWLLAYEHRKEMRGKIRVYLNQVQRDLIDFLR